MERTAFPLKRAGCSGQAEYAFVVIVVNQWLENKKHFSTLTGFLTALPALALLGPDSFLLPALACSTILLIVFRKQADDNPKEEEEAKA